MLKNILLPAIAFATVACSSGLSSAPHANAQPNPELPGYTYGDKALATSPVTMEDLELLKKTVLFTEEDAEWLRKSRAVLEPQAETILDTWYGFVGSHPHLLYYFNNDKGAPDTEYLTRVRGRFIQWIFDTTDANYDQAWLDYNYEIGRRHHRIGKNVVDGATGPDHINYRYMVAFIYPITATLKPFLQNSDYSPEEVDKMHQAWTKSVIMQVILWTYPYVPANDF